MPGKIEAEIVRKTLDLLIDSSNSFEDLTTVKFAIDDYIDEGYYVMSQIQRYNDKVKSFYSKSD